MSFQDHDPYHLRSIDQQVLDALLRIEKLLNSATEAEGKAMANQKPLPDNPGNGKGNSSRLIPKGSPKGDKKEGK
jgi:hypothetical protein